MSNFKKLLVAASLVLSPVALAHGGTGPGSAYGGHRHGHGGRRHVHATGTVTLVGNGAPGSSYGGHGNGSRHGVRALAPTDVA